MPNASRAVTKAAPTDPRVAALRSFYGRRGRLPSYGELAALLKFKSKNAARYVVEKWIASGLVAKDDAGKLVPGPALRGGLRMLGTVAAGWPSPAEEENVDTISLDDWLIRNREASFMLTVTGDSMIDAGIHQGDVVILERGRTPKNGDVVVAEVDRDWTIKYFEKRGERVRLIPANAAAGYAPIEAEEEMRIAGVVTAVIRKYAA